jgi:hypothetical protein
MDLFHRIDDAEAIVRVKGGVFKQSEVFRRRDRIYVKHGSGFIRVTAKFGDTWGTSAPGVNVLDISAASDLTLEPEPRWTGDFGPAS